MDWKEAAYVLAATFPGLSPLELDIDEFMFWVEGAQFVNKQRR